MCVSISLSNLLQDETSKRELARSPEIDDRPRDNSRTTHVCYNVSTFRHMSTVVLLLPSKFNYTCAPPAGVYWRARYSLIGIINYTKRVYRIAFSSPPFPRGILYLRLPLYTFIYVYIHTHRHRVVMFICICI